MPIPPGAEISRVALVPFPEMEPFAKLNEPLFMLIQLLPFNDCNVPTRIISAVINAARMELAAVTAVVITPFL